MAERPPQFGCRPKTRLGRGGVALVRAMRVQEKGIGPSRLADAAVKLAERIPAPQRHRIAVAAEGDPLELGGRTHPPTLARLKALAALKQPGRPVPLPTIDEATLLKLDERLTRQWLTCRLVDVNEFFTDSSAPRFASTQPERSGGPSSRDGSSDVETELDPNEPSGLELDDWRR